MGQGRCWWISEGREREKEGERLSVMKEAKYRDLLEWVTHLNFSISQFVLVVVFQPRSRPRRLSIAVSMYVC